MMADSRQAGMNIVSRIERLPVSPWHTKIRAIIGIAWFFDGFDALTIAFVLPVIIPEFHLSAVQAGLLISSGYGGQAIGSVLFGWLAGRIGRVPSAAWTVVVFAVASLLCSISWDFSILIFLRFIQGLGLGGEIPVMHAYVNELASAKGRGRFVLTTQLPFAIGIVAAGIVAVWVVPNLGWRWMFVIGAVPALVIIPMRRILPESPRWLASKGRLYEADQTMTRIEEAVIASRGGKTLPTPDWIALPVEAVSAHFADIFRGVYLRRTVSIWIISATTYFVGYGLTAWMPTLYRTYFALSISQSLSYGLLSNFAILFGCFLVTFCCDIVGRKNWITGALMLNGLVLSALYLASTMSSSLVVTMLVVAFACNGSVSILVGSYAAENYPTHLRGIGNGLANFWPRVASVIAPFAVGWLVQNKGIGSVFMMFGIAAVMGSLSCALLATETRERILEEVSPPIRGQDENCLAKTYPPGV